MSADWKAIARSAGFVVSRNDSITVTLRDARRQTVNLDLAASDASLRIWSIIATPSVVRKICDDEPERYAWERNRFSDLLGFATDGRGRLIGEAWIPADGVTADEFRLYVRELARVCDWHEMRLMGEDVF